MKLKYKADIILIPSQNLMNLGLTKQESLVYQLLLTEGALTASEISKKLNLIRNASYRLLRKLVGIGFITLLDTTPATFQARRPSAAIDYYLKGRINDLEDYASQSIASLTEISKPNKTRIDFISNKNEMFSLYARFAKEAKKQILIISIGEDVPDETRLANRDALAKNINIRFIPQKYDKENRNLLEAWKKMGIQVRYYEDAGYHLVIFDQDKAILMASNTQKPTERNGVVIYSQSIAKALTNHFEVIWGKAKQI